ncbi:MAG: OmpA family protein, partial [Pseudomonadota bacterium]
DGETSDATPVCLMPTPPGLGCGAVVHGIGFDFDSDAIRPESQPVIEAIHEGLSGEANATFQIIGHSSSEGEAEYNRDLSHRRAEAVVAALVTLGLDQGRLSAAGKGEDEPIASNDDEAGRSLNRRVEIRCAG